MGTEKLQVGLYKQQQNANNHHLYYYHLPDSQAAKNQTREEDDPKTRAASTSVQPSLSSVAAKTQPSLPHSDAPPPPLLPGSPSPALVSVSSSPMKYKYKKVDHLYRDDPFPTPPSVGSQRHTDKVLLHNSYPLWDEIEKDLEEVIAEEKRTGDEQSGVRGKPKRKRASDRVKIRVLDSEKGTSHRNQVNGSSYIRSTGIRVDSADAGSGLSSDDPGLCEKKRKRVALLQETEAFSTGLGVQDTEANCSSLEHMPTRGIEQEDQETRSNECSDQQDCMAIVSRGGIVELDQLESIENSDTRAPRTPEAEASSHKDIMLNEEEGCFEDVSRSDTCATLLTDTKVSVQNSGDQQSEQSARQDKKILESGDSTDDVILSQNAEQRQPILFTLEDMETKLEDEFVVWPIKFGEVKHCYKRRRKRLQECFAASGIKVQLSGQISSVASTTPDLTSVQEQAEDKDVCVNKLGLSLEDTALYLPNRDPSLDSSRPTLDLSVESEQLQKIQSTTSHQQAEEKDLCLDNVDLNVNVDPSLDSNRQSLDLLESEPLQKMQSASSQEHDEEKDLCLDNVSLSFENKTLSPPKEDPGLIDFRPSLDSLESEPLQKMQTTSSQEQAEDEGLRLDRVGLSLDDKAPSLPNKDDIRSSLDLLESEPLQKMQTTSSQEQAEDEGLCLDKVGLSLDDKAPSLPNKDPSLDDKAPSLPNKDPSLDDNRPSLDLSEESDRLQNMQSNKAAIQAKKALRWSRELMMLVADGYSFKEESTGMDGGDRSVLRARKRRRLQKTNNLSNTGSEIVVVSGRTATQNASPLHKDAQWKWRDVEISSTDPIQLIGCRCKVYWPDDKNWYTGVISGYSTESRCHHVDYDDGDNEDLILAREFVKLYLSEDEIIARKLPSNCEMEQRRRLDFQEMAALATVFEDFQEEFRHGELVWAKIKGHPMWPAFVMDEKHADAWRLDTPVRESTLTVQFFGSYDYARISTKQAVSFSKGLLLKLYGKCKKATFDQGLKEAERYLKEGKLPDIMSKLQDKVLDSTLNASQVDVSEEDQDFMGDERTHKTKKSVQSLLTCPIKLGDLQVISLGKIVRDSEFFHNENQIWTEGYTAVRKFPSVKDPETFVDYRMEIIKDPQDRTKPLFCVTSVDGEVVEGSTPSICWKKVFQKLDNAKEKLGALGLQSDKKRQQASIGDSMFGFTNPQILKLIQALPYARVCFKFTGWFDKRATENLEQFIPAGFKPVEVDWKHADRCSVCDLDEEYTNNLLLQCDRCRILVHMHCYGVSEPPNGHLWLCQSCQSAQNSLCCLCPVQGGAMKKTTDGRWAHLTCAMWIPETCFVDVKHMEPIDGLKSINKERWKLTCSICKVPYGVCIQCSEPSCYSAYHVLCARSSGFVLEVSEDSSHRPRDGAEDFDEPVRFLSYCKRHRQSKLQGGTVSQGNSSSTQELGYCPPKNNSGCARTEPYNGATRRGRQEPEVRAAASAKRHYVEKMPYLVSGFRRQDRCGSDIARKFSLFSLQARNLQTRKLSLSGGDIKTLTLKGTDNDASGVVLEDSSGIYSVTDRYQEMRLSLKHRLTFGKSAIHGWGVFTKRSHRAGDMVIEYAGKVVRPIVADLRERLIYNTLVGAGTYMFRIDDERVVDATCEGTIAHLINHSCEPNCFSRVVTVSDGEHIIIFAKRDIEEGEELSYDYRFTSKGEQLECFCGFPSCRGFVNVNDADEETSRILVPRREITPWTPF